MQKVNLKSEAINQGKRDLVKIHITYSNQKNKINNNAQMQIFPVIKLII